jgi:Fe(3+) dicitrate transport protein
MKLTTPGVHGTESNRVSSARAIATFVQYSLRAGKFLALPGIRYERVEMSRLDYGKSDPERTGVSLSRKENRAGVWIPGVGLQYEFSKRVQTFAGMHKGFAPQGFDEDDKPEASTNYELGMRLNHSKVRGQVVMFYTDYSNLLGADLAAGGGGGTGDLFNAGEAVVHGVELELNTFLQSGSYRFPITMAYTYTDGTFGSSFVADNEDWGSVQEGDRLPYLANNQLTFNIGLQHSRFDINVSSKYVGVMRTAPGQGDIASSERLDGNFVVDISSNTRINRTLTVFGSISNLTDQVYEVARRPAGLRPGMPRSFMIGLKASF